MLRNGCAMAVGPRAVPGGCVLCLVVREGRTLWFLNNSANLHALVKGTSSSEHLCRAVGLFHMFSFGSRLMSGLSSLNAVRTFQTGIATNFRMTPF